MARQVYLTYIEPTRIFIYVGGNGAVLQLPIPWEIMHDMEIIDKEKLNILIQNFIKTNALPPGPMAFALAPQMTFEADFPLQLPSDQQKIQLQKFLDTVPFQEVASQFARFATVNKAVAGNKTLIDALKNIFEEAKFNVTLVVPVSILMLAAPELQTNLDMGTILNKADLVHQFNLISQPTPVSQQQKTLPKEPPAPPLKNKRTLLLIGVFGALMVILIVMVFTVLIPQSKPVPRPIPQVPVGASPTINQTLTPVVSISPIQQIINTPTISR